MNKANRFGLLLILSNNYEKDRYHPSSFLLNSLVLLLMLYNSTARAQSSKYYECLGSKKSSDTVLFLGRNCTPVSSDYHDFYSQQSSWKPNDHTSIKYINVVFNIIQKDSINPENFVKDNPNHIQYLDSLIIRMNYFLSNVEEPSDPRTAVCGDCHSKDARLRINGTELNFIVDPEAWGNDRVANYADPSGNTMIVSFVGDKLRAKDSLYGCISGGAAHGENYIWMARQLCSGDPVDVVALNLLHELLHTFNVNHVYPEVDACNEKRRERKLVM